MKEEKKFTIHRILSWPLNVLFIAPTWIITCVFQIPFDFFNNLHYKNFWKMYVSAMEPIEKKGIEIPPMILPFVIIGLFIGFPIGAFIRNIATLKELKF